MRTLQALPVDEVLEKIVQLFHVSSSLVIEAAPGAGKTTRIPPRLLSEVQGQILVLEPRRIAATSSAERVAEELNEPLGLTVGYQVRFDHKISSSTRLIFMTEALLLRRMLSDPLLKGVDVVILDEFHERSLHTDLALALLYELRELSRPDLKIIVMSATIDGAKISAYLHNCPRVQVPGQPQTLEIRKIKQSQSLRWGPDLMIRIENELKNVLNRGHILVFLPGSGEIRQLQAHLQKQYFLQNVPLLALHGGLSLSEQRSVLSPSSRSKIILTTNLAESAITVDGVDTVIDTGLAKINRWNPSTGNQRLQLSRIAKANAKQRAGRSARQKSGLVIQLWNSLDENSMPEFETPSLFREDLCEALLLLAQLGIAEPRTLSWFESPPELHVQRAQSQLQAWGALDAQFRITQVGQKMSQWPLHPRWSRLLLQGQMMQLTYLACELAALLSEKFPEGSRYPSLLERWEIFRSPKSKNSLAFSSLQRTYENLLRLSGANFHETSEDLKSVGASLLFSSHQDRLCRRRNAKDTEAQIFYGKGVTLPQNTIGHINTEFFYALDLVELETRPAQVSCYFEIDADFVEKELQNKTQTRLEFGIDPTSKKLTKFQVQKLGPWAFSDPRPVPVTSLDLQNHWPEQLVPFWEQILNSHPRLANSVQRWNWYSQFGETLKDRRLSPLYLLQGAVMMSNNFEDLLKLDFEPLIEIEVQRITSAEVLRQWTQECPRFVKVPSGQTHELQYHESKDPELSIRIQEIFGWTEAPQIRQGKSRIRIHLLGPNFRPVQVTQDLASFWINTYPEIRKELRLKYPKHSWPEDPFTATAVAKGHRRGP